MMAPITPHIAEELWEYLGKECFVSTSNFPNVIEEEIRLDVEEAEEFLKSIVSDINEILNVTGIAPKHIRLYTSPKWKMQVFSMAIDLARRKELTIPGLTKMVMKDQVLKTYGKEASDFARKTAEALLKCSNDDLSRFEAKFDEFDFLSEAAQFLKNEFGCEISVHSADDPNAPDPQNKAKLAIPRRPAIYVE